MYFCSPVRSSIDSIPNPPSPEACVRLEPKTLLAIQELAELLQVDHSTMSRNVKKLMQADLVETFQDDADKRRKMIALSAVGRQVLDEATESINLTISNALQSLDEDEIENVITNLRKYSKALEGFR